MKETDPAARSAAGGQGPVNRRDVLRYGVSLAALSALGRAGASPALERVGESAAPPCALILNDQKVADKSSRMDLRRNADGSVDLHCGPKAPVGFEQNWIPTVPGRNWFAYFRFYQPTEAYFDRSWPLPDFEPV